MDATRKTISAEWNEKMRYYEHSLGYYSDDGDNWTDAVGEQIEGDDYFDSVRILLVGGPRDGVIVG